jgi:hypothetical protein
MWRTLRRKVARSSLQLRCLPTFLVEVRFQTEQALQRGVRAIAFIATDGDIFFAGDLAGIFVEYPTSDLHGGDFCVEETFLLGAGSALLT